MSKLATNGLSKNFSISIIISYNQIELMVDDSFPVANLEICCVVYKKEDMF